MEVDRRQILPEDRTSDCRSFGSNFHPSSQSRKISIGIMINSLENKRSGATKENNVIVSNAEREISKKGISVDGKNNWKGVIDAKEGKQNEVSEKVTSPWIATRSFLQKPTALPTTSGRRNKLSRAQDATIKHSVQFFANQISVLHSDGDKQKKFDGFTYNKKGSKDSNSQKPEEFTFATAQKVLASDKAAIDDKREEGKTETLRMKQWEILGIISSPRSQPSNSNVCEADANNLKPKQIQHQKGDAVVKPIQNSDTIETDSENPDCTMKRAVTSSYTRKKVANKAQPVRTKTGPSSSLCKQNFFLFGEGIEKGDVAISGGSLMSRRKKGRRKSFGIEPRGIYFENNNADKIQGATCKSEMAQPFEPHRIYFNENNSADKIQAATCRSDKTLPVEKGSSLSDKSGSSYGGSPQRNDDCLEGEKRNLKGDSHQSARANRVDLQGDFSTPLVPANEDQQQEFDIQDLKNVTKPQEEFQSPTFKINTPTLSSSPCSTPKADQLEQRVYRPGAAETRFTLGNIRTFRNLQSSKADYHASNAKAESSDDAEELKDSPSCKPFPFKVTKEVQEGLSESSSADRDSKSSEEGFKERNVFSPETATAKRSHSMLYPAKRLHNHEGNSIRKFSPTLPSPKGIGKNDWNPETSEQTQENELERVITMFASALENFKNKMKSATRKKSTEILISVSEEIRLQLKNVELQIQTDVGKLTCLSKSKRKRLETRFQEQQDKLKWIHDKFKQDIHQHLQECKRTVEELEMHHIELKGTMKKQKASHQKLLMEVEEAIKTKLDHAQRRITAVNKSANEKMLQLQHGIVECLNEGRQDDLV